MAVIYKRQRGQAQCGLADVEATNLVVEDILNRRGVWPFVIVLPTLSNETAKGEHEEDARSARAVEHLRIGRIFHGGERLIDHQPRDGARRVMDAGVACRARVGTMAEALVHLAQHTHRNVGKVEVTPIDLGLNGISHGTPALENRVEVGEYPLADQLLGSIVEAEYAASRAARSSSGIDSSISGRKSPLKVASSHADVCAAFSAVEKASLSSGRCRTDAVRAGQLVFQYDVTVDQEAKEQARPAIESTSIASIRPFPSGGTNSFVVCVSKSKIFLINVVRPVQFAVLLKGAMHEALKEEGRGLASFFDDLTGCASPAS